MSKSTTTYFMTCALIWGVTWIAIKFQLPSADGSVAVFYRFAIACAIMFILARFFKQKLSYTKQDHMRFFFQGLFMFCLNFLLTYWAESMATSALVALAFTSLIFFNMFGGKIFLKIPLESKVVWGAIISCVGMGFITLNEYQNMNEHPLSVWGFLLSLIATASASAGNLISSRNRALQIPIFANIAWAMLYGVCATFIFCLSQQKSFVVNLNYEFLISFFYLTIFGTVISFWAYLKLISAVGPAKAAFTSVASPVIALFVSTLFEHMTWSSYLALGVLLCLVGNVIALVRLPSIGFRSSNS